MQHEIIATMDAVPRRATAVTVYIRGLIPEEEGTSVLEIKLLYRGGSCINKIKLQSTSNHHDDIRLLYKAKSDQTQQRMLQR
jgi:hypothetical protein